MLSWSFAEWPNDQTSVLVTDGHDPVYLGSDDGRLIKATAILSTPMAVLSRGAKGNDRCVKADGRFIKANGRFIKRREKQCVKANGRFIKANGRFIKGRNFRARLGSRT